jgi:glycosyltransferase involved in cell wall biosynthesis
VKILWVGDAVVKTGFAKVTHAMVPRLIALGADVTVLGSSYAGDPHDYPYAIYPATAGGDAWGVRRVKTLVEQLAPDLVVVQGDPWNVREFLPALSGVVPVVGYMPIDSQNVPVCKDLNPRTRSDGQTIDGLALAIWYTAFARDEAVLSGYTGPSRVVALGIDPTCYAPRPRRDCLKTLGLDANIPTDAFIVGNVNRNQPRKRLDLTLLYFAAWWDRAGRPDDAYLYLHTSNLDTGPNLMQLAVRVGLKKRLIITHKTMRPGAGVAEDIMPSIYSLFDAQLSTTQGEGWGLTTMEGMACGVPQIVPDYAALGEWPREAVHYVPATLPYVTCRGLNSIGMAPDATSVVDAIDRLADERDYAADLGRRGRRLVAEARFDQDALARQLDTLFRGVVSPAAALPPDDVVAAEPVAAVPEPRRVRSKTGMVEIAGAR